MKAHNPVKMSRQFVNIIRNIVKETHIITWPIHDPRENQSRTNEQNQH